MLVLSRKNDEAVVIGAGRFENILKVTCWRSVLGG